MPYGLYVSAEGALFQDQRMEVISNNLANVTTPGFKRDLAVAQARYSQAIEDGLDYPGSGSINDIGGGVEFRETKTDFRPGPIRTTHSPTDWAIAGEGFFVVRKNGENHLTRAGNFQVSPTGLLVTGDGYPVLSSTGNPIAVDPASSDPLVGLQGGRLSQGGLVQELALVQPASPQSLQKVGDNLFKPQQPPQPVPPGRRHVKANALEMSGVNPPAEMMELIEASRMFEANITLIRQHDQLLGALANRVLRVQ